MTQKQRFARLRAARRVWAVASIHGEAQRLDQLHRGLLERLQPGDRIVYLGNMIGRGEQSGQTLDRLLRFRRAVLAGQNSFACDVAYLRGQQEEMWQKLLQLQFSTEPLTTLDWMLDQGMEPVLRVYGSSVAEARRLATSGAVGLTRWTNGLRAAMQARPGHYEIFGALRRAAFTEEGTVLFVNCGLDPSRPLEAQRDSFWWSSGAFGRIAEPYGSYRRIVRGYDPSHGGFAETDWTVTLDGGCGFDGPLIAACLGQSGQVLELLDA